MIFANIQPSIERRAPYGKCHFSQRWMEKCGLLLVPTIVQPWLRFHRYPCRKHQILPSSFWKPQCWIEVFRWRAGFCVLMFFKGFTSRKTQEGNEWNNNWEVVVKKKWYGWNMLLDISQTISKECQEPRLFLATAHSKHGKVKGKKKNISQY